MLKEGRADVVKMEGGQRILSQVKATVDAGIAVMGHVGLTPQSAAALGGFRCQGKTVDAASAILNDALALQSVGCFSIVLEFLPDELARYITGQLEIPTIGIGSGVGTSGQVQVYHDLLGMFPSPPRFSRRFAPVGDLSVSALECYVSAVRDQKFPAERHTVHMDGDQWNSFLAHMADTGRSNPAPASTTVQESSSSTMPTPITPPSQVGTAVVVGAGPLGLLVAARLSSVIPRVRVVDRPSGQKVVDAINNQSGIAIHRHCHDSMETLNRPEAATCGIVEATADASPWMCDTDSELADLVIIAVKSSDTADAAKTAAALASSEATILSLQNGDNLDTLAAKCGPHRLVVGTTTLAANCNNVAAGHVVDANPLSAKTKLVAIHENEFSRAESAAKLLNAAGLGDCSEVRSGIQAAREVLWRKLAVNAVLNPLTGLLDVSNGGVVSELESLRPTIRALCKEFLAVASAKGLALGFSASELEDHVLKVAQETSNNISSTLADLQQQRTTEISAISGTVVAEGEFYQVPTPTHAAMLSLIAAKQRNITPMVANITDTSSEMALLQTVDAVRKFRKFSSRGRVGLVPTMGGLHAGHASLVQAARKSCDTVISSLFVNPSQFSESDDFNEYPRTLESDLDLLRELGCDAVFVPDAAEIYPPEFVTAVEVNGVDSLSEGAARPGFFRGVATVCTKLFNIVEPTTVFFGQKDALQCCIIRRIVADLNMPINVVVVPTKRDDDGLAMSTRNAYLSSQQRKAAPVLYKALLAGELNATESDANRNSVENAVRHVLRGEPMVDRVDYISLASPVSGHEITTPEDGAVLSAAITLKSKGNEPESVRLLDNVVISLPPKEKYV